MWNALVKIVAIVTFGLVVDDLGSQAIDKFNSIEGSHNPNTGETKLRMSSQPYRKKKPRIQNQSGNRKRLPRS